VNGLTGYVKEWIARFGGRVATKFPTRYLLGSRRRRADPYPFPVARDSCPGAAGLLDIRMEPVWLSLTGAAFRGAPEHGHRQHRPPIPPNSPDLYSPTISGTGLALADNR